MKKLNYMNCTITGLAIALFTGSLWSELLLFLALLSLVLTGIFQLTISLKWRFDDPDSRFLHIYTASVAVFFILLIATPWEWIWLTPPALALYFSALLFIEAKKEQDEP